MKYYYLLFIDAVTAIMNNNGQTENFARFWALIYVSMAMSFNLLILREIIYLLSSVRLEFSIEDIGEGKLHSLINYIVIYFSPPILINYFLVIRNSKWKKIIKLYSPQDEDILHFNKFMPDSVISEIRKKSNTVNGMLALSYFLVSLGGFFIYGVVHAIINSLLNG